MSKNQVAGGGGGGTAQWIFPTFWIFDHLQVLKQFGFWEIDLTFYAFDGLSTCLLAKSLGSFKGEIFSPVSALSPSAARWSSWMGLVPRFSEVLDPWLVKTYWHEWESKGDSAPKSDRTVEQNNGCIDRFLSENSRNDIRQTGHVECCCSHMSMQVTWKKCPQ